MSLINQMLRDLDARKSEAAAESERDTATLAALPTLTDKAATPTPVHIGSHARKNLMGVSLVAGLAVLGLATWFLTKSGVQKPVTESSTVSLPESRLVVQETAPLQDHAVETAAASASESVLQPVSSSHTAIATAAPNASIAASPASPSPTVLQDIARAPVLPPTTVHRASDTTRRVSSDSNHAIQLKLDELLTFNVRAVRSGGAVQGIASSVGGDSSDLPRLPARLPGTEIAVRPGVTTKTAEANSPRIEKIERQEPGASSYWNGLDAIKQGRVKDAVDLLNTALRENPKHLDARQALLGLYIEQRDWEAAQAQFREGLALAPEQTAWVMGLARIQVERGQPEQALETLQKHEAAAGRHADYQGFTGVLLQNLKKPHEAVERYRAALKLRPREGRWWYALGTALEEDGQDAEAKEIYRRALGLGGLSPSMVEAIEKKLR